MDTAVESAEIQQLRSLLQEREKEIERLEVHVYNDTTHLEESGWILDWPPPYCMFI